MAATKPTCFVIQSFDGATYDRRYRESIRPALLKAEVEPQRADEILGLNPIVEKIEKAIEAASICIAEVSEDNPNVWLELGYALALNRPAVILCDKAVRSKLPFDVQHRPVIFYRTDSRSGIDELESQIVKWVRHELANERRLATAPTLKPGHEASTDLEAHEVAILSIALAFWPTQVGSVSHWELERKLTREGYTDVGIALGISSLLERGLVVHREVHEESHDGDTYVAKHYQITPDGIAWLKGHKDLLTIRTTSAPAHAFDDADIPF
jgi:hypothetical protein